MKFRLYDFIAAIALAVITANPAAAIIGGQPDGNGHPNVGALDLRPIGFPIPCSGTLVSPTVYVTAGHCTNFLESRGITQARVTFDPVVSDTARFYTGVPHTNPGFFTGSASDPGDIGVVVFPTPIQAITPAPLPPAGLLDQLGPRGLKDQTFSQVGYGVSAPIIGGGGPPQPTPTLPAHAGWPPRPSTRSRPRSSTCRRSTTASPVPAIPGRRSSLGARSSPKATAGTRPAPRWRPATGSIPLPPAPSSLTTSACRNPGIRGALMAAALVVLMVDCCNRHDTDALAACYAPDARVHPAGWPQAVDARTRLATFGVILATFPDLRLHPRNLAANGRVALRLGLVQRVAQVEVEAEGAGISAPISTNHRYGFHFRGICIQSAQSIHCMPCSARKPWWKAKGSPPDYLARSSTAHLVVPAPERLGCRAGTPKVRRQM
jgi:hypothetical protein